MARLIPHTPEGLNEVHNTIKERLRLFEEALRKVAWDHGFTPKGATTFEDFEDWDIWIELEYTMDHGTPPKDKPTITPLPEGVHTFEAIDKWEGRS